MIKQIIKNKKGQSILDVVIFIVIVFIIVLFFGLWRYGFNIITERLTAIETPVNSLNLSVSNTASNTFGLVNTGLEGLKVVGLCLIFGMILTIFISNFLIRSHPIFFVGYIFVTILAIILSFFISNFYQNNINNEVLSVVFQNDPFGSFILLYLPIWVCVIGFIGGLILFSGIYREEGAGGF
jgi:hypothetical protein